MRGKTYLLNPNDVDMIELNLHGDLNNTLVIIGNKKISSREFLRSLPFKGFSVENSSDQFIAKKLNRAIRSFIEDEFLAEEGYQQGLQNIPEVRNDIEMWKDFYFSTWLNRTMRSQINVSDSEIEEYIRKRSIQSNELLMVNIQEILVDSLQQIEYLLKRIYDDEDFGKFARTYSKRKWAAEKNGEFGFFPSTMYGAIGETAAKMEIGEIFAPIETKDGYSIIKLLDKKLEAPSSVQNYEDIKEKVRTELKEKKFNEYRDKFVAKLAQNYVKKINYELLNSVKVTSLNMFTYRFMGFGGRLTAVPLINRYTNWYNEWLKFQKQIP